MAKKEDNRKVLDILSVNNLIIKYIEILKKNKINPVEVYLYGSYAKGTANKWSDIDIAIVVKKFIAGLDNYDFDILLTRLRRNISLDIEPHSFLEKDFNETYPPALEILKTGKKIK
ncbi:MAG: nucleotidyltransferase domain-containing protein [Candidatus Acidulodesulfobacterium sp.]